MIVAIILTSLVLALLITEKWHLDRQVRKVPLRILVNGTRGKSTVVKYIASMLRENDLPTTAKITGVTPTVYKTNDINYEIKRRGGARVTEQFGIIRNAAKENVDALVLECMSITPELQIIESKILKPHYYIITNIREDHLEDFGASKENWIHSICDAIPANSRVITADKENYESIKKYADKRNSEVIFAEGKFHQSSDNSVHADNVNIALAIAEMEGYNFKPDVDKLKKLHDEELVYRTKINDHEINFINCFSANDVRSAEENFDKSRIDEYKNYVLFNSRADRPLRSKVFMQWISGIPFDKYFLTGSNKGYARRVLMSEGISKNRIITLSQNVENSFMEYLKANLDENYNILGCGNIKGDAFSILNMIKGNG